MSKLEDDTIFLKELQVGHQWQLWAGFQFLKRGFIVQVPPLLIRPSREDIDAYSDHGDIFLWRCSGDRLRFECKSRSLSFTGRRDYPFPTAFVDRVETWKRKANSKPAAILLVSQETGAILAIDAWTESDWVIEEKDDSVRGYRRSYYLVPRSILLEWDELISHINGQLRGLQ